jgi:hypothetical protein
MDEIALVMAAYPTSFERKQTSNLGTFHMIQERQSNMASRSMGKCGNTSEHHYFNERCTNTSLVPLTSPFMNMINYLTRQSGLFRSGDNRSNKDGLQDTMSLEKYQVR